MTFAYKLKVRARAHDKASANCSVIYGKFLAIYVTTHGDGQQFVYHALALILEIKRDII